MEFLTIEEIIRLRLKTHGGAALPARENQESQETRAGGLAPASPAAASRREHPRGGAHERRGREERPATPARGRSLEYDPLPETPATPPALVLTDPGFAPEWEAGFDLLTSRPRRLEPLGEAPRAAGPAPAERRSREREPSRERRPEPSPLRPVGERHATPPRREGAAPSGEPRPLRPIAPPPVAAPVTAPAAPPASAPPVAPPVAPAAAHVASPVKGPAPGADHALLERGHGRLPEGFAKLGVKEPLLRALRHAGFEAPTEIQEAAIPVALLGKDVVGQARTGSGKTAAFGLPTLQRILNGEVARAIILTPTRELCVQVRDEIERFAGKSRIRASAIYGGVPLEGQRAQVAEGREILVGTPGRVLDLARRGWLDLGAIQVVVLDECDRMFDLGFRPDIERIMRQITAKEQLLLFSATINQDVEALCERYAKEPTRISTIPEKLTVDEVEQHFYTVAKDRKRSLLIELIRRLDPPQALVFVRTRIGCEKLAKALSDQGVRCAELHGDLRQEKREKVLDRFREGKITLLIATDVAARGLDILTITHVFNYDIPEYAEDYVHRIGRTARMGSSGKAVTLVEPGQGAFLTEIEKLTNVLVKEEVIEGFDAGLSGASAPAKKPRATGTGAVLFSTWSATTQ